MDAITQRANYRTATGRSAGVLDIDGLEDKVFTYSAGEIIVKPELKNFQAEIEKTERQLAEFTEREAKLEIKYQEYVSARNFQLAESTETLRKQRAAEIKFTQGRLDQLKQSEPGELENFIAQANSYLEEITALAIQPVKDAVKEAEARLKAISVKVKA